MGGVKAGVVVAAGGEVSRASCHMGFWLEGVVAGVGGVDAGGGVGTGSIVDGGDLSGGSCRCTTLPVAQQKRYQH